MRRLEGASGVIDAFGTGSFESVWYWTLTVLAWGVVGSRVLGVPYDMILRARRRPQVAERVEVLAHIAADRIGGIYDKVGVPLAAAAGFALAALFAIAFGNGLELATAAFLLAFPLAIVVYSTLRLALAVRRQRIGGDRLVGILARRRVWHLVIGVAAMMTAVSIGLLYHPPY